MKKLLWNIASILILAALAFGAAQVIRQALKPSILQHAGHSTPEVKP